MKIKSQHGRSMIEMLGVLGIMAVITVLGITAYTMATKNIKVNKAKAEIFTILQQWDKMSGDTGNGGGPQTYHNIFVNTGLMKSYNAFGFGDYPVTGGSVGYATSKMEEEYDCSEFDADDGGPAGQTTKMDIQVLGLSDEECSLLRAQDWGPRKIAEGCWTNNGAAGPKVFTICFDN